MAPKEPKTERGGGGRILAPPSTVQEACEPRGWVSETLEPQFCESYFRPAAFVGECIPDEAHFHTQAEGAGSGLQLPPSPDKIPSRTARLGDKVPDFSDLSLAPGSVHVFDSWVQGFLRICSRTPICLGAYVRLSLQPSPCTAYEPTEFGDDIWPVPPPAWRCWSGPCKLGPRRRRKQRTLSSAYALVQRVVCCLNWLTLGYPKVPPPQARVGAPCTAEQSSVIDLLLRHALHFVSQGSLSSSELGRSAGKFDQLAKFVRELPELPDVDMDPILHDVYRSLDPYSRPPKPRVPEDCEPIPEEPRISPMRVPTDNGDTSPRDGIASGLGERRALGVQACKPVVASRIKWKYAPSFNPEPFLRNPLALAAFCDPNVLRLAPERWPRVRKAQVHASRSELLALGEIWDSVGALRIYRKDEISDLKECVGLFCVPKDDDFDRLILNPVVVNSRMQSLNDYTKLLGHGAQLCALHIPDGHVARYAADDLAEFYYTVEVGSTRAKRNIIGMPFAAHELSHLTSFDRKVHFGTCFLALSCLAMGDSLAVELAQQSHHEVLRTVAGCMLRTETVAFRRPFPRGPYFEFLCIDDHIGIQCLSRSAARAGQRLRDTTVFEQANAAYKAVKLVQHPVKCQRDQLQGTLLGASFDGDKGIVSAPSDRILVLMLCTGEIARRGSCTPQLLQTLLGCWIHVLLFRRPAFCVLNNAFADAALQPSTRVIKLSRLTRNELFCIACLGPVLQTDLRASWCPKIFVMDASPTGAALCSCDAPPPVVQELWRFTEQRGYHTRLEGPATAALREKGFESSVEYIDSSEHLARDPFPLRGLLLLKGSCGTAVNSAKGPLPGEPLIQRSGSV